MTRARSAVFTLALLATASLARGEEPPRAGLEARLRGAWRGEAERDTLVAFDGPRCRLRQRGVFLLGRVAYRGDGLVVRLYGQHQAAAVRFAGDTLLVDGLGVGTAAPSTRTALRLVRLAAAPPELEAPVALRLGTRAPGSGEVATIASDLVLRGDRDQSLRREVVERSAARTPRGARDVELDAELRRVDGENVAALTSLVQDVGWIDVARFGKKASGAAFLVAQHSLSLPLTMAVLPEIERDVKAGSIDAQPYALLHDRLRLQLGERQTFGTQVVYDRNGDLVVGLLEDAATVDERRRARGLGYLADYLAGMRPLNKGRRICLLPDNDEEP